MGASREHWQIWHWKNGNDSVLLFKFETLRNDLTKSAKEL